MMSFTYVTGVALIITMASLNLLTRNLNFSINFLKMLKLCIECFYQVQNCIYIFSSIEMNSLKFSVKDVSETHTSCANLA